MLKQRIITALIMVVVLAFAVFYWPPLLFAVLLVTICVVGGQEWAMLQGLKGVASWLFAFAAGALCALCLFAMGSEQGLILARVGLALWVALTCWLVWCERRGLASKPAPWSGALAFPLLITTCVLIFQVRDSGPWLLLYMLAIAWAADIGAYFTGKKFGRRKLAARLSPGKSIEGFIGGLIAALLLSLLALTLFDVASDNAAVWIFASVTAAVFSVAGDLVESTLKRVAGVKDSGWVLPGHGGVLDRVDSLLASVPVFVALFPAILP